MKVEIGTEWVSRLRDPNRVQTRGALERAMELGPTMPVGQCCWGVLCEMAAEAGITSRHHEDGDGFVEYGGENAMPPDEVYEWAGIKIYSLPGAGIFSRLATYNDQGETFAQIADRIEAVL